MSTLRRNKKSNPELTFNLARKWGQVFNAPVATIMTIVDIESGHDPKKVNMTASAKGGAWGLGQQMLDEAEYKLGVITSKYGKQWGETKKIAKRFNGTGQSLLDPELNIMITAWQLGRLHRIFGDFPTVAAAYHQGEGAIRSRLAAGEPAVGPNQPKGRTYVAMAEGARQKYLESPMMMLALAD